MEGLFPIFVVAKCQNVAEMKGAPSWGSPDSPTRGTSEKAGGLEKTKVPCNFVRSHQRPPDQDLESLLSYLI
jgi:hypothetical protein